MNFAQFSARHFKGRVACYEVWNEPDGDTPGWHVDLSDYLDLVRVTAPVIQEEDPNAKIAVGATRSPDGRGALDYLLAICASDVMRLADVLTWYAASDVDPSIVEQIVRTAAEHGFTGACMSVQPTNAPGSGAKWNGWQNTTTRPSSSRTLPLASCAAPPTQK